ncbi:MAG TPA: NAD(P)H-hydrate dehydratase, partial [Bdellovibrionota bacterium]|nr:NAD(P)H-hydrate dehydratase [Bdellovibrionota bacterium]
AKKMVHYILKNFQGPLVVDADALNSISEMKNGNEIIHFLQQRKTEAVFTPHPGEFSRLTHYSTAEVQKHRTEYAQEFAHKWNVVLVLKGSGTVIASPRGETFINPTGNPGMASAGMGDVLTGMIAGLLAQGLKPLQAAQLGVYLHGFIGDRLKDEKGVAGLLASDLMSKIPESLELFKTS